MHSVDRFETTECAHNLSSLFGPYTFIAVMEVLSRHTAKRGGKEEVDSNKKRGCPSKCWKIRSRKFPTGTVLDSGLIIVHITQEKKINSRALINKF